MKILISLFALLPLSPYVFAQPKTLPAFTKTTQIAFDSCKKVSYLINTLSRQKEHGRLVIPIKNKKPTVLITDTANQNWQEYNYLGNIKGTDLALVREIGYNNEIFLLISQITNHIDTLIGRPFFADDLLRFACVNNPSTDEAYLIQMGEIKNGVVRKSHPAKINGDMLLTDIRFYNKDLLFARDNDGRYWKIPFYHFFHN